VDLYFRKKRNINIFIIIVINKNNKVNIDLNIINVNLLIIQTIINIKLYNFDRIKNILNILN
jgi:hypothetical protein